MSEINVNEQFAKFGKKALIIAILNLVSVLVSILVLILPLFLPLPDLNYLNWIIQLIIIVVVVVAATHIFKSGQVLNNQDLLSFRKVIVAALILVLIANLLFVFFFIMHGWTSITPLLIFGTAVLLILIIGIIFEIIAWRNLKRFFINTMSKFPEDIGKKAKTGCFLNQLGSIFYLTIILAFVGFIIKVIGYFLLYKLKDLDLENSESIWKGEKEKAIEPSKESIRKLQGKKILSFGLIVIIYGLVNFLGALLFGVFAVWGVMWLIIGLIPTILGIAIIKRAKSE